MDPSVSSAPLTSEELEGKKNVFRDLIAKIDEQRDRVLAQRNETFVTMDAYKELVTTITAMQQTSLVDVRAQVDLGSQFYVQAVIPDARMVFVDVGVGGFHVEFTLDEALAFIAKKQLLLQSQADLLSKKAAHVTQQKQLVLSSIQGLRAAPAAQ